MTAVPQRARVLIFTLVLGGGGAEMQALRIANHLDRKRFDVEVAVLRGGGSYESALASDVQFHVLPGKNLIAKAGSLRTLIRRTRPDIVCSFLEVPNLIAAWASRSVRPRPHVIACVQAPPSITWRGGGLKRLFRAMVSQYYRRAERIIAISRGVAEDIAKLAPGAEAHTTTVYNAGVDERLNRLMARPLDTSETRPDAPLLVACGRLTEQKGFPYLLDAMALVRQKVPDAVLWILGEGPDRPALEQQIADLSLGDSVRLLGFRDNPYSYMASADLFVLSSIFEGFGNVVAEALACGTAVVATDCPYGPSEIITDGVSGLLVPPRDPAALAEAIVRVLTDPELRSALAQEGKRRSRDFTAETISGQYAKVFEDVLHRS
jgi:glycosyltransferase involved in cell wall biosynthesis